MCDESKAGTRQANRLLLAVVTAAGLAAGCSSSAPIAPHPTGVRVPYPQDAPTTMQREEMLEMYSTSPLLNPDGLGTLQVIQEKSYMTLVPWETVRQREERNKLAFARSDEEQESVITERRAYFENNIVFEGILLGDFEEVVRPEFYGPEGVYLLDDAGKKFFPTRTENLDPLLASALDPVMADGRESAEFLWIEGSVYYGFPRISFPRAALTRQTRSITLYFAILQKRVSFTWIFDPEYEMPDAGRIIRGRRRRTN